MKSIIMALFLVLLSIPALANEPLNYEIDNLSVITGYSDTLVQTAELEASESYEFINMAAPEPDEIMSYSSDYPSIKENFEFLPGTSLEILFSYGPAKSYHVLYLPRNRDCNCRSSRRA